MMMSAELQEFRAGKLGMEHHGKPLQSTPANMTLDAAVYWLRVHQAFTLVLEPGDMTRYVLTFLPVARSGLEHHGYSKADLLDGWLVLRTRMRGDWVAQVMNTRWDVGHHNVDQLADGNEHSANVLVTFLSQLFSLVRAEEGGRDG